MQKITSVQAQSRFGELLDLAQREPVAVTRRGRTVAYVISEHGFKAIQEITQRRAEAVRWYDEYAKGVQAERKPDAPRLSETEIDELVHATRGQDRGSTYRDRQRRSR